jgi:hypothetical protein
MHVKAKAVQNARDVVGSRNFLEACFRMLVQMLTPDLQLGLQCTFLFIILFESDDG